MKQWETENIVDLLQNGLAPGASESGPMASVVLGSTQHLSPPDLKAMAQYLKALTAANVPHKAAVVPRSNSTDFNAVKAAKIYEQH